MALLDGGIPIPKDLSVNDPHLHSRFSYVWLKFYILVLSDPRVYKVLHNVRYNNSLCIYLSLILVSHVVVLTCWRGFHYIVVKVLLLLLSGPNMLWHLSERLIRLERNLFISRPPLSLTSAIFKCLANWGSVGLFVMTDS